ncbi:MAG: ABC transporter ATP-binding protein [Bdellovibrionales bacterium]
MFEIKNIEFKSGEKKLFSLESEHIKRGQNTLLLGPSGCGKTTLMNIMAGLLKPASGEIVFERKNYATMSEQQIDQLRANNFGFIFQTLHLIGHLSVAQNIALVQTTSDPERVQTLINELGLSGKEKQKASDLSVGEAQRVAIARAVANNPKVIFADEPTSALDDLSTKKVMDLIFDQAKKTGATIIAATHDDRIKKYFDTVLELGGAV